MQGPRRARSFNCVRVLGGVWTRRRSIGQGLARSFGLLEEVDGEVVGESGGSDAAKAALVEIVGKDVLRDAVDYYISFEPGFELARSVLWVLRPLVAMERCYEIYKSSQNPDERHSAIELLRVVGDRRAVPWIPEFLSDDDPVIRAWGIGLVDQLAWSSTISEDETRAILNGIGDHPDSYMLEKSKEIEDFLRDRDART